MAEHLHNLQKISIHALREEGDFAVLVICLAVTPISIHALREEGDIWTDCNGSKVNISIHALREEGDQRPGWNSRNSF